MIEPFGNAEYQQGLAKLQARLPELLRHPEVVEIIAAEAQVLARYQPVFTSQAVPSISAEDFISFLLFQNNHHWSSMHRQGPRMVADLGTLRSALGVLLDETQPLPTRLDAALKSVNGMGKGVATAILLVAHPAKYGVWNNTSEEGLKQVGLWPRFDRGASHGAKYAAINLVLTRLAKDLNVDLWALDSVWWAMVGEDAGDGPTLPGVVTVPLTEPEVTLVEALDDARLSHSFGLERHLHDFLHDNWEKTDIGREWDIYSESGSPDAGYEYSTGVGAIDLLCKHKSQPRWLVIELKRGQTSDETMGQVMRYMGWVKEHLAAPADEVAGMIIARANDERLKYALSFMPSVSLQLYEVEFRLRPANTQEAAR